MSFKRFDYLSPKIALFYYGSRRHSANLGGILTIIMMIVIFVYVVFLFLQVYLHKSSTFQYYPHFFRELFLHSFNNSKGIFHYFQIYNPLNSSLECSFNSKYVRLFMSNVPDEYKSNSQILSETEHWVYDDCRDGIDNKFLSEDLFKDISIKNGLCLRYYFDKSNQIYYSIDDKQNFKWPNITSSGLNSGYSIGTIIEKCNNNSVLTKLFGLCGEEKEIENYLDKNNGINFNILTSEINPSNYGNQIYTFIYGLSNPLQRKKTIENNIVISPIKTEINEGLFFPTKKINYTYSFQEHDILDEERINESNRVLSIYKFRLSQFGYVFKGSYLTIYDSFPQIGGIIQLIYYIFFGINFFYNRFTIIDDTKKLFFTLHNDEQVNGGGQIKQFSNIVSHLRKIHKNITTVRTIRKNFELEKKENKIINNESKINNNYYIKNDFNFNKFSNSFNDSFFQKNFENDNSRSLSIFPLILDKNIKYSCTNPILGINDKNIYQRNSKFTIIENHLKQRLNNKILKEDNQNSDLEYKNEKKKNSLGDANLKIDKSNYIQIKKLEKGILDTNNFHINTHNYSKNQEEDKEIAWLKSLLHKFFNFKKKNFLYEKMRVEQVDSFFTFGQFFTSLFCYKKPRHYYLTLTMFRKKLLSEEHFFRTHNYLYLFEKCFDLQESKKIDIIELYKNL